MCVPTSPPLPMDSADTVRDFVFKGYPCSCRVFGRRTPVADPVVVVGGALQNKDSWWTHQRYFGPDADVVTVDLPGSGSAGSLPARYGHDFQADALEHVLAETGLRRVSLVGISYGSLVAYRLARRRPDLVARMVLNGVFDGVPTLMRTTYELMVELIDASRTFEFAEAMLSLMSLGADSADPGRSEALSQMLRAQFCRMSRDETDQLLQNALRNLRHPRLRPFEHAAVPTLVVTGEHDRCTPPEVGRDVARMIPGSVCVTFDDAGHVAFLEHPQRYVEMLRHFFAGRPTAGLPHCTPF
ncbi:alpha/beta hydrolase [Streptomyces roseirectus]|uniref:Alpha/beta hydrolase n=1 Tax=Streptomyces roseirectus TaxID=2768066 RepID=A0A7H0I7T8_9ACTN|nr:alpha/beta hydrolase [Streptomyces roseirectus]QNP68854.1 alpha/beta hydrolase [Streptomyces roseirectus]